MSSIEEEGRFLEAAKKWKEWFDSPDMPARRMDRSLVSAAGNRQKSCLGDLAASVYSVVSLAPTWMRGTMRRFDMLTAVEFLFSELEAVGFEVTTWNGEWSLPTRPEVHESYEPFKKELVEAVTELRCFASAVRGCDRAALFCERC
jgi:hypothetical protein